MYIKENDYTTSTLSKLNSKIWKLSIKFNYYYMNQILKFILVLGLNVYYYGINVFLLLILFNTFYNIVFFYEILVFYFCFSHNERFDGRLSMLSIIFQVAIV